MIILEAPRDAKDAVRIQNELRNHVIIKDDFPDIHTVAGIDVGYDLRLNQSKAALVLIDAGTGAVLQSIVTFDETPFPYIPGLLSFREAPVILKALTELKQIPDILFVDGHGIAHPRRLGIAAHVGVISGFPAIGVAKSLLCGKYTEPDLNKGSRSDLIDKGEKIGTVLRSKDKVKPLFISPGHRVGQESAVMLVEKFLTRYRLPEPTRLADKLSKI